MRPDRRGAWRRLWAPQGTDRDRYIFRAALTYAAVATAWILVSDRILTLFVDPETVGAIATLKGLGFVAVTTVLLVATLRSAPAREAPPAATFRRRAAISHLLWYPFAVLATLATLWLRLATEASFGDQVALILFVVPIGLSAFLGGLGPGLVATAVAAVCSDYFLLSPRYGLAIESRPVLVLWLVLIVAGVTISFAAESLRRARGQAERRREQLAVTLASIGEAVITTDAEGHVTFLNAEAERLTGWTRDDAAGEPLSAVARIVDEGTRQAIDDPVRAILASDHLTSQADHTLLIARDRRETVIDYNGTAIRRGDGPPIGVVIVARDCTERKLAEQHLKRERDTAQLYLDVAGVMLLVLDTQGSVMLINHRGCEILGYGDPAEIVGKVWIDNFLPERDRAAMSEVFHRLVRGEHASVEYHENPVLTRSGEERLIAWHNSVLADERGRLIATVSSGDDITERKQAERALRRLIEATIEAMARTIELRDPYTAGHQQRVALLAVAIGRELGLPEMQIEGIKFAALIHDLGKINVPAEILSKPGTLSKAEYTLVMGHPQAGYEVLRTIEFPWPIAEIVREHHERVDGTGYPRGLKGEEMLVEAKIIAVADVMESMRSHRPYRPAASLEAALAEIRAGKGHKYDAAAVDACLHLFQSGSFDFDHRGGEQADERAAEAPL